jgi:hypothetical protein
MSNIYEGIDLQTIDIKSLTDEQWIALKRHIIRKAHAERSKAIGALFARLKPSGGGWRKAIMRASEIISLAPKVQADGPTVKGG